MNRLLLFFLLMTLAGYESFGQVHQDSIFKSPSLAAALSPYEKAFYDNLALYDGKEYSNASKGIVGNPYFVSNTFFHGSVCYSKEHFNQVPLMYDMVSDQLITKRFNNLTILCLQEEKVDSFKIHNHVFVKLQLSALALEETSHAHGFYDLLYESCGVRVLAKRTKNIQEFRGPNGIEKSIQERDLYYIQKDSVLHRVMGKQSCLNIFGVNKKKINKQLDVQGLKYRKSPEKAMVAMAKTYCQIYFNEK